MFVSVPNLTVDLAAARVAADSAFIDLMREDLDRFWECSAQAGLEDNAVAFAWKCRENTVLDDISAGAVAVLARGCFSALMEVFRRYPGGRGRDELPAWFESARSLSRCFDRIGIWPLLAEEIAASSEMRQVIRAMAQYLDAHIGSEYRAYLGEEPRAYAHLHFIHWVLNLESVEFHRFDAPDEFPGQGGSPQRAVIVADLESLPVTLPSAGRSDGGDGGDELPNLYAAVRALLGNPLPGQLDDHALELMLFAAACQVSADYPLTQGFPWFSWHSPDSCDNDAQREAVEALVRAAISWLAGNLPSHVSSPQLEQDILSGSSAA
ncbi:MAG: hypothetical protein O7F73_06240 [Gammaproteobacteria bacterium]|nr:hypothetical protein [Gammaproteobacteria bacterium]